MEPSRNQQLKTTGKKKSFYWDLEAKIFPVWRRLCPESDGGGGAFVWAGARIKGTKRWEWIEDCVMDPSRKSQGRKVQQEWDP